MVGYAKAWGKGRKYYIEQQKYRDDMKDWIPKTPPMEGMPWEKFALVNIHFRLWNWRDPLELIAGLKWPVDFLVDLGWMVDDNRDCLVHLELPTQEIARKNRGVDLTLRRMP